MQTDRSIDGFHARVTRLRRELQVVCAEHGLAQRALDRHLPPRVRTGDVAWAMAQGVAVEHRLEAMADELIALEELMAEVEGG